MTILALGEEETLWRACDGDAEEVVQVAEVRHGELVVKMRYRRLVEDAGIPLFEHNEKRVGDGGHEAEEPEVAPL